MIGKAPSSESAANIRSVRWHTTQDGSRFFQVCSTSFAMQGNAPLDVFHNYPSIGDQFPAGSYLVQGKDDLYAKAILANEFDWWRSKHP